MASGIVYLYDFEDRLLVERVYYDKHGRIKAIERMMQQAKPGDYIQIYPRRTNFIRPLHDKSMRRINPTETVKKERPPAIYNNIKTYNYGGQ